MSSDAPIVISGGSVSIQFDDGVFFKTADGKFFNANKKIRRIEISGDGVNINEDIPNGKVTIKIFYSSD